MKTFIKLCFISSLCVMFYGMNAQYITLQGKQFYNQSGQPFYPVICNYDMRFSCNNCNCGNDGFDGSNCDSADYQLQPSYMYGSTGSYEHPFAYGMDKVRADFVKIKQMGFNTVRVMTLFNSINKHYKMSGQNVVTDTDTVSAGGRIICVKHGNAYNDGVPGWWGHWFKIDTPYATNQNFQKIYLPKIKQLLDTAASVGIHVIFVTGAQYISAANEVTAHFGYKANQYHEAQASYYANYLKALVSNLKTKPALFAYDLYNEAEWNAGYYHAADAPYVPQNTRVKNEICRFTSMWYDTVKANDPNHLVTMGNGAVFGIFDYDPAIMKLDFNCHHIYPPFFYRAYNNYNRQNILDVFNAQLHWASRVNPLPWMLGEIGAIAWTAKGHDTLAQNANNQIPTYTKYPLLVGTNLSKPPYGDVWGNFADQDTFARWSQQAVLNHGGSGYAWWQFQDELPSKPYTDTVPPVGGLIGLLKPGDPNGGSPPYSYGTNLDKPLVSGAFMSNTPTTPNAPYAMPANYYNPFGGTYFNYHGRVVDQNGHPIRDAVVHGSNAWYHSSPGKLWYANNPAQFPVPKELKFDIFTFTREDGTFDLIAPVPQRPLDSILVYPYDYGRYDVVRISAPAANSYWWNDTLTGGAPSDTLIVLYRQQGAFDDTVKNLTISAFQNQTHTARHILYTKDVTIDSNATADFHATTEVVLLPGFDSKRGSNTVVYIAPVDFDCNALYDGTYYFKTDETEERDEETPQSKSIDVLYSVEVPSIRLIPNPASDAIYVETDNSGSCAIEISSMTGGIVYSNSFYLSKKATIDVSSFAIGTYNVLVKLNKQTEIFKLIINH